MGSQSKFKARLKILSQHGIRVTPDEDPSLLLLMTTALDARRDSDGVLDCARALHRRFDEYIGGLPRTMHALRDGVPAHLTLACKEGCSYCCTIRVTAWAAEVFLAASFLKTTLSKEDLQVLIKRLVDFDEKAERMEPEERIYTPQMCPLNVENKCSIYSVRPLSCRRYHSFDVEPCKRDVEDPRGGHNAPADPARFSNAFNSGPDQVFKAFRLDMRELEFVTALRIALEQEDALSRFLAGDDVFARACREDFQKVSRDARQAALGSW